MHRFYPAPHLAGRAEKLSVAISSSVNRINIVQKLVDKRVFVP
jgi:hypothetical protein